MLSKAYSSSNHDFETPNTEIKQLRIQVNELKEVLNKLQEASWKETYSPSNIRKIVENEITSSGMYKLGRWVISTFVILGALVWLGGTIYSGIQIESLEKRAEQTISELNSRAEAVATELEVRAKVARVSLDNFDKSIDDLSQRLERIERKKFSEFNKVKSETLIQIRDAEAEVASAARAAQSAFDDRKAAVSEQARFATEEIYSLKDSSLTNIKQRSESSLETISQEQERAKELLNVANLPDLRVLKAEIAALEKSGGELNLENIHKLVHWSWWVFVVITILLAMFGIFSRLRWKTQ